MKLIGTQLKRLFKTAPITIAFVLLPFAGLALEVKDVPNPRQINGTWVTDMAQMLDESTQAQLNSMISELERENGTEIAVVTVPETAPAASPKEFTTALFNYWGIGKKGQDNGVLFLISKGDRRVEIETGYGIEAILPDAKVGNIIDTEITPRFKQGDFKGGTLAGTKALVVALRMPEQSSAIAPLKPTTIPSNSSQTTLPAQPRALEQQPIQDGDLSWVPIIGGGLVLVFGLGAVAYKKSRQVFLEPEGRTRLRGKNYCFYCTHCKKRMEEVDTSTLELPLSKPEKVAQKLGSVTFEGWKCLNCSQQLTGQGYHLVALVSNSSRFSQCPICQELTAKHTIKILQNATQYSNGKYLVIDDCQCCNYHKQREEIIPRLPPPPPPSSSSSSGSCSSSSSSSSSGSFGGGSSGGGGAGGSW